MFKGKIVKVILSYQIYNDTCVYLCMCMWIYLIVLFCGDNSFHNGETNQHHFDIELHMTRFCWYLGFKVMGNASIFVVATSFQALAVASAFVTSEDHLKRDHINFKLMTRIQP